MTRFAPISSPHSAALAWSFLVLALVPWLPAVRPTEARGADLLVPQEEAARQGLLRMWYAQVPVDARRSRVSSWRLYYGRLYAVTDSGIVAAIDAETGETLWTRQVGKPGLPALGPAANAEYLAVVVGNQLIILNRDDGRLAWTHELGSAPLAGAAISRKYVYVALPSGRIEGYLLDDPKRQPWFYQSKGRTYLEPTTTGSVVSWPATGGMVYVSDADEPNVRFRLETNDEIVTSPAEADSCILLASLDGYIYCLNEEDGHESWRFSTGYPITSSPAIVGNRAYVASLEPALHAVDLEKGTEAWMAPGVSHFAAKGKNRVYAADRYGNLIILDAKTGAPVGGLRTGEGSETLVNDQTDRVFVVTPGGLVQAFRELDANEPTKHRLPFDAADKATTTSETAAKTDKPAEPAATEAKPAAEEPAAESGDENPFTGEVPANAPAEPDGAAPAEDDNPFN